MNKLQKLLADRMDELKLRPADVAKRGGLTEATVSRYLAGDTPKRMQDTTIAKWAKALNLPESRIREAAQGPRPSRPFVLSPERQEQADALTPEQSALIKELIRMFDEANRGKARDAKDTYFRRLGRIEAATSPGRFHAIDRDAEFEDIAARNWREGDPGIDEDVPLEDS